MSDLVMGELDPDPTTTIYLVRHGDTIANDQKKFRGWGMEGLNAQGKQDAVDAGQILRTIPLQIIYSSDLPRAIQTAQAIRDQQASPPVIRPMESLRTIDVGAWTGRSIATVEPAFLELQAKWRVAPNIPCPAGESFEEFQNRQISAWGSILTKKRLSQVAVVSHLRCSIWAMGYAMLGHSLKGHDLEILNHLHQFPATVTVLTYSRKEGFKILQASTTEVKKP
jgi:broad specificity phosphatase PhoE